MSWILFYFLIAAHIALVLLILVKSKTWTQCLILLALLVSPAAWYCSEYFTIKATHAAMCNQEGGLRIFIRPEKSDQVRWVGSAFDELTARTTLETKYPRAKRVEATTEDRGSDGQRLKYYVAYTAAPHETRVNSSNRNSAAPLTYSRSRVDVLSPMYEVSSTDVQISNGRKVQLILSTGGVIYAIHTELTHWWKGIHYPDAVPTWRCPGPGSPSGRNEIRNLIFD